MSRPIEQLSLIEWARRRVYLLFDTNVHTNPKVAYARNELAQELSNRGAEMFLIDLPYGETRCYIRDPDGYIIEVGQSTDQVYG